MTYASECTLWWYWDDEKNIIRLNWIIHEHYRRSILCTGQQIQPLRYQNYLWPALRKLWPNEHTIINPEFNISQKNLYKKNQYKDTCPMFGKYCHNSRNYWHKDYYNLPKYHYCNKLVHNKKNFCKRVKEEKSGTNNNWGNNRSKCGYCNIRNHEEMTVINHFF